MLDFLRRPLKAVFDLMNSEENDSEITREPQEVESPVDLFIAQKETKGS